MKSIRYRLGVALIAAAALSAASGSGYSLEQCKDAAIKNNVAVQNALLEVAASKQLRQSVFTKFFPKIDAQVLSFKMEDPLINIDYPGGNLPVYNGNPATLASATQFAYFPEIELSALNKGTIGTISAMQPLFAGGRISNGYRLADVGREANEEKLLMTKNEVLFTTEERYWQIVTLRDKLKTLDFYGALLDTLYKEADDALKAGLINRNDLLKVSIKQIETQADRCKLENGIALAAMALCQYLGRPYDSSLTLTDSLAEIPAPAAVYLDSRIGLRNRHEYALLQEAVKAEKLQTKIKIGEYMPEIGVGVGELYLKDLGKDGFNAFVCASAKVPISGLWEAAHTIRERKIKETITERSCQNNIELMQLQIEKSWKELNDQFKQIELTEKTLEQASENLKVNSDNYKAGIVNISDMLEAQALYKKAKDDRSEARINYKLKVVTYMQVTGR